jgi:hypothetical protein
MLGMPASVLQVRQRVARRSTDQTRAAQAAREPGEDPQPDDAGRREDPEPQDHVAQRGVPSARRVSASQPRASRTPGLGRRTLRIPVEEDPRPDGPVQLSWQEFPQGWERITSVGFPVERTAEEAWPHFRGWRINYEAAAVQASLRPRRGPRPLVRLSPPHLEPIRTAAAG